MPRHARLDATGTIHHGIGRGIAGIKAFPTKKGGEVGTLFHSVPFHSPEQRVSLSDCCLLILHYQRNAARLQQLFQPQRYRQHLQSITSDSVSMFEHYQFKAIRISLTARKVKAVEMSPSCLSYIGIGECFKTFAGSCLLL